MNMQDILSKVANAKATKGGNRIVDGEYEYLIESFGINQGHEGTCFIAELRVTSAKQAAVSGVNGEGDKRVAPENEITPNAVGSSVSFVANVTKHASANGNVKAFILSTLGVEESQVTPEQFQATLAQAIDPKQPLRGRRVANRTYRKLNQGRGPGGSAKRGEVMTLNNFIHVPGQTAESIAAGRQQLDTGSFPTAPQVPPSTPPTPQASAVTPPTPAAPVAAAGLLDGLGIK